MFRGRYQHTIDPKGRLSVPSKFRDALAQLGESSDQLVVVPNEHALEVHPLTEWQRIEDKLNAQPMFTPEVRQLSRLYMSRAKDVTLDNVGRVLLPPDTRKEAGLELSDRIRLTIPEADADLLEHEEWIARETLAVSVEAAGVELLFEKG